jgi:energy-coupling factor transporter ATP-binding protein EcfA2
MASDDIVIRRGNALGRKGKEPKALIEGVLWEKDIVMLLGQEKAGKSILAQQLAFALTSGQPFLGKYKVKEPMPVLYLQTEGKPDEMDRRIECMAAALDVNREYFMHVFKKNFSLDVPESLIKLVNAMKKEDPFPKVLIIDSLYTSMIGDLNENTPVRKFNRVLSTLQTEFGMTIIFIHHETKDLIDLKNPTRRILRGDKGSYGSVYLRAYVDHILYLRMLEDSGKVPLRELTCDTARSGAVMQKETLRLMEPDPLYFNPTNEHELQHKHVIRWHVTMKLGQNGNLFDAEDVTKGTGIKKQDVVYEFMEMLSEGVIERVGGKYRVERKEEEK